MPHRMLYLTSYLPGYLALFGGSGLTVLCWTLVVMDVSSFYANQLGTAAIITALGGMLKIIFDASRDRRNAAAEHARLLRESMRVEREAREKRHGLANRLNEAQMRILELEMHLKQSDERVARMEAGAAASGIFPAVPAPPPQSPPPGAHARPAPRAPAPPPEGGPR